MAKALIDKIRQMVLADIARLVAVDAEHDPWTEAEEGVAYIDNELGFLDQLRGLEESEDSEFSKCNTVIGCKNLLNRRGPEYIRQATAFIEAGGTNNQHHFDLRNTKDPIQIKAYLDSL